MKFYKLTEKEQGVKLGHQRDRASKNIEQYNKDLEALKRTSHFLHSDYKAKLNAQIEAQERLEDIDCLEQEKQEAIDTLQRFVDYVDSGEWRNDPTDKVTYEPHY